MAGAAGIRAGRAYVEVGADDTALARGLRRAEARLRAFGASVQAVGRTFAGLGALAAAPLAAAAKVSAGFEQEMARVKAITNASGEDFAALGDRAKQLGRDTVFSAADAARAMGNFAQAGFKVGEILAATGPTLDLAATAQIDVAESAQIAAKVMRGMGVAAEDLGAVIDVMAKAATTSNTDIVMLGDAFKFVGPVAKTAGVSLGEITAAIQLLSNAGIQGEMAGTTLRGMLLTLNAPGGEAAKALDELGVKVKDGQGNFLGLAAVLGQLEKALAGMGNSQKLEKLGTIFPDRQAAGAAELVAQGAERLAGATKALGDSTGTAARIARTQLDTLFGAWKLLESSVEGLVLEVGAALTPALREWGSVLVGVANGLAAAAKANAGLVAAVAKGAVGAVAFGAALYGAGLAAKALAAGIGVMRAVVVGTTAVIYGANAAFRLLTVTVNLASVATTVFAGLSAVLAALATPVGVLAVGLAALAGYLIYTGDAGRMLAGLGEAFQTLRADAELAFGGIAEALRAGDLAAAGRIVVATLKVEWLRLSGWLRGLWAGWGDALVGGFDVASRQLAGAFANSWALIQGGFVGLVAGIQDAWIRLVAFLKPLWIAFAGSIEEAFVRARQGINAVEAGKQGYRVQQETAAKVKAAQDEGTAAIAANQAERSRRIGGIQAENLATHAALDDGVAARAEGRRRASADAEAAGGADLAAAEQALRDAVDATRAKVSPAGFTAKAPGLQTQSAALTPAGLGRGLSRAKANVEAAGTFSSAALFGMGTGGSLPQRQLDEAKETTKELKAVNAKLKKAGPLVANEP